MCEFCHFKHVFHPFKNVSKSFVHFIHVPILLNWYCLSIKFQVVGVMLNWFDSSTFDHCTFSNRAKSDAVLFYCYWAHFSLLKLSILWIAKLLLSCWVLQTTSDKLQRRGLHYYYWRISCDLIVNAQQLSNLNIYLFTIFLHDIWQTYEFLCRLISIAELCWFN